MVLVDGAGSLVAGAGAWPVCEELAAYAPLLAGEGEVMRAEAATALEKIRPRVRLKALWFNGAEVLLAARGAAEQDAEPALGQAASGCLRILGAGA